MRNLLGSVVLWTVTAAACGPTLQPPSVSPHLLEQEAALQRELLFKTLVDRQARLQRIYTPLRIANADLCGADISPVTGLIGIDRPSLPATLRNTAHHFYGVNDGITVIDIVPNSPAAQTGLQPRDVITGAAVGKGVVPSGWTWSGLTIPDLKVIENSAGNPMTLLVRRGGAVFPLILTSSVGCNYPIQLVSTELLFAGSDGKRIIVGTGLFNHIPDDREVAVIVSHELAHNVLKHREKKEGNRAIGGAVGLIFDIGLLAAGINTQGAISQAAMDAGGKAYSQDFEFEADYLALYMLARAGFDIGVAPNTFRRMGIEDPSSQIKNYVSTHPSMPERAVAMKQTIAEIQEKASRQEALLPKNLEGQALAVNTKLQVPAVSVVATQPPAIAATLSVTTQPVLSFAPASAPPATIAPVVLPSTPVAGQTLLAQLYLIRGPVVSTPPQAFNADFNPGVGKARSESALFLTIAPSA